MDKFIVGFGSAPREYIINGIRYVVESRFQKPDYKKPRENTLLNNRIGNYLTSDFADLPSVDKQIFYSSRQHLQAVFIKHLVSSRNILYNYNISTQFLKLSKNGN